jgi:hypothetical protein
MNNALLLVGAICLVAGVMGYMFTSDQADICERNAWGSHYYAEKYSSYKLYSYLLAGLSVMGGVMCAAGIFSNPSPRSDQINNPEPPKKLKELDKETRKKMRFQYLKYGGSLLLVGAMILFIPYISILGFMLGVVGFMVFITALLIF